MRIGAIRKVDLHGFTQTVNYTIVLFFLVTFLYSSLFLSGIHLDERQRQKAAKPDEATAPYDCPYLSTLICRTVPHSCIFFGIFQFLKKL